jgi:histone acetyltransferase HTATIP/histone acetyltransferase MYST1
LGLYPNPILQVDVTSLSPPKSVLILEFYRRVLSVLSPEVLSIRNVASFPDVHNPESGEVEMATQTRKKKRTKGFEGEVESETSIEASMCMMPLKSIPGASSLTSLQLR